MERSNSNIGHSPSTSSSSTSLAKGTRRTPSSGYGREDDGLVMREKTDKDDGSVGKAGAVGVGVTKPKRRLSSLPSLPHPFHFSAQIRPIPAIVGSPSSSPNRHSPPPRQINLPSTYHVLQNAMFAGSSTSTNYLSTQTTYRPSSPRMDEKGGTASPVLQGIASRDRDGSPRLFGVELKWISLITLALQNAFLTIIMHYSRISAAPSRTYSAASAVFLNELLKGSISVVIALKRIDVDMLAAPQFQPYSDKDSKDSERRPTPSWSSPFQSSRLQFLSKSVFSPDCYKLSVPAILYVIQNNLQYVAASNLDVATFQVTYQMKILTTAFFSVLLLHKRLTKAKWASLVMLAVGVAIVQLQSVGAPSAKVIAGSESGLNFATKRSSIPEESILASDRVMRPFRGFLAVTLACLTSGLAGVYFEFILKASSGSAPPPDLWVRNTQLSLFSLVPALVPIVFARSGPDGAGWIGRMMASFNNFNGWALGTVLTQTLGGLITAVVIRYSDNIMKAFATSLSIIISFLASVALFSYPITLAFVTGSSIVLASTYLYNASSASAASITRNAVGVQPGSPIPTTAPILGEPDRPSRASSVINLLGLGSSSGSSSRQTSSNDLRGQAKHQLSFTQLNPVHHANGFYSASAPGTPYSVSGYPSSTSIYESSRGSPNLSVNIPPGRRSPGESSAGSSGSKSDRPVLSLEIGRETIRGDD